MPKQHRLVIYFCTFAHTIPSVSQGEAAHPQATKKDTGKTTYCPLFISLHRLWQSAGSGQEMRGLSQL
ncbi:hypothetical protein [uncultured Bacteroides sp.]|uniref:hypothetical protein n=1 Tax=uncultured Bacteroides sp. TaxID=162156 RepID=UPI00261770FC|nr:hypothetical protein [uncultured Bacteroides sp.]